MYKRYLLALCTAMITAGCTEHTVITELHTPTCKNMCEKAVCASNHKLYDCVVSEKNGCKEIQPIVCPQDTICQDNACIPSQNEQQPPADQCQDNACPPSQNEQPPAEQCHDACTKNTCSGPNAYLECLDTDNDGCREFAEVMPCSDNETCVDGSCIPNEQPPAPEIPPVTCEDTCTTDLCDGTTGYRACKDINGDGCKELSDVIPCGDHESCSENSCKPNEQTACKYTEITDIPNSFHAQPNAGQGRIEEVTITTDEAGNPYGKTYHDLYLVSPDGRFKVGMRKEYGGAITFLGKAGDAPGHNTTNVIDSNDTGRMVQVAVYDGTRLHQGCAYNASCRVSSTPCPTDMDHMGWNPVQGGNRCNQAMDADVWNYKPGEMSSSVEALTWNPHWDLQACTGTPPACSDPNYYRRSGGLRIDQTLRWVGTNTVEVLHVIHNLDDIDHPSSTHEFPTLYAPYGGHGLGNYNHIYDSNLNEITGGSSCGANCITKDFNSPERWISLQNSNKSYGIGIYYEGAVTECQLWKFTNTANRGSCMSKFAIPAKGTVVARSYLIIGSLADVNLVATHLIKTLRPFGVLDTPNENAKVNATGKTHISGWALDNKGVTKITVSIDEGEEIEMSYGNARPDVIQVYPNWPGGENVGYKGEVSFEGLSKECKHLVTTTAYDADGNKAIIAKRLVEIE